MDYLLWSQAPVLLPAEGCCGIHPVPSWASGEKPVIPLSSLECLAFTRLNRSKQPVCPLLWGGGGKVYSAPSAFRQRGSPRRRKCIRRPTAGRSFKRPSLRQELTPGKFCSFPIHLKNVPGCFPAAFPGHLKPRFPGGLQMSFSPDSTKTRPYHPGLSQPDISVTRI